MNVSCLAALAVAALSLRPAHGEESKGRYNVWSKEKIRYHHERVQQRPDNPELRVMLAGALYADGNCAEAIRQLQAALKLRPAYPEAHCNLGVVLQSQSRVAEAEAHFRAALEESPDLVEAMAGLGTLLCAGNRHGEGIRYLERTLQLDGRRDDARYNLGVAYHKAGDFRRAIEQLEQVRQRQPEYPGVGRALAQACFARGLTLLQARQPAPAIEFFRQSESLADDPDVHYAEGIAHLRLGDLGAAEQAFRAAVAVDPDHVPALHNLAHVLEQTNRLDLAEGYYRRVAALTPHLDTIEAARNATYDESYLFE